MFPTVDHLYGGAVTPSNAFVYELYVVRNGLVISAGRLRRLTSKAEKRPYISGMLMLVLGILAVAMQQFGGNVVVHEGLCIMCCTPSRFARNCETAAPAWKLAGVLPPSQTQLEAHKPFSLSIHQYWLDHSVECGSVSLSRLESWF